MMLRHHTAACTIPRKFTLDRALAESATNAATVQIISSPTFEKLYCNAKETRLLVQVIAF
jgi:hypothetical protein